MSQFLAVHEPETGHRTIESFQLFRFDSQQPERVTQFHEMIPARGHHHELPARGEYPGELGRIAGCEHAEHGLQASRNDGQATPDVGDDGSQPWTASGCVAAGSRGDINRQAGRPGGRVQEGPDVVAGSGSHLEYPAGAGQGGDHPPGQWLVPAPCQETIACGEHFGGVSVFRCGPQQQVQMSLPGDIEAVAVLAAERSAGQFQGRGADRAAEPGNYAGEPIGNGATGHHGAHDSVWSVQDKPVVLVTGATRGIGRVIAEKFLGAGYRVAGTHRAGGEVPEGVLPVECDITDQARVEAAFERVEAELGSVEVLVANAGVTKDTLLARMSDADWETVIDTNLTGTFRVVRRAVRPMTRTRFGRIILISSVVGLLGSPGQVNYAASKSALIGMARSLARELGSRNITANVITPGFIETDMTATLDEKVIKGYRERIPASRLGQAEDVAGAALFLAEAGYVSGAVIPVDGGLGMGH